MKAESGNLDFKVEFGRPNEIGSVSLPVEIRRPNLSLVKTGLTTDRMTLEPGKYLIISKLPAGQELFNQVEIKADAQETAVLTLNKSDESPHESEALQHFLVANRQTVLTVVDELVQTSKNMFPAELARPRLRFFTGNLLSPEKAIPVPMILPPRREKGLLEFRVAGRKEGLVVQLLQTDTPPLNMLLPAMNNYSCQLFVTSLVDGRYTLDAHLENRTADILLRYSNKGYSQETELLSQEIDAEELLRKKMMDPIAAAVGAYALLRFNQLEKLHDWTENLRRNFKWLPDGAAIRGEHLAQMGQHEAALDAFLEIETRGLPIFSNGLSFLIDRLSAYLESRPKFINEKTLKRIKNLNVKLQKFAAYADFREPFTTFTGFDISEPSAEIVKNIPKNIAMLNLTELLE